MCAASSKVLSKRNMCVRQTCLHFNKTCATVLSFLELCHELCMACCKAVCRQHARQEVCDMQVQVQILQMMDMSAYAIVASEVAYLAAQWNELPALQTLESEGRKLTCAACSDN